MDDNFKSSGNTKQAKAHLEHTLAINSNHAKALGQLGQLLLEESKPKQAALHFTLRLNLEPHDAETWHSLGQAELQLGKINEAIDSFKNCLKDNEQHSQANQDLANAYVKTANFQSALTHYFRQLNIAPNPESYYNVGVLLMYQDHHQDALDYLNYSLQMQPDNVDGHINIAHIYLKQNKLKLASQHYQKALAIKPDNPEIQHIMAALDHNTTPDKAPKEYVENLFNQYAPYYDKHLTEQLQYNVPQQLRELVEHDHHAEQAWTILDLGCGSGLSGLAFKPMAKTLIGIDLSADMIKQAANKNIYDQLRRADVHDAITEYSEIDCIIAADVFTYIGNLSAITQACYNALRPGGLLAFSTERSFKEDYRLQNNIRYCHHQDYLKDTLKRCGFTAVDITPCVLRQQQKKPVEGYLVLSQK